MKVWLQAWVVGVLADYEARMEMLPFSNSTSAHQDCSKCNRNQKSPAAYTPTSFNLRSGYHLLHLVIDAGNRRGNRAANAPDASIAPSSVPIQDAKGNLTVRTVEDVTKSVSELRSLTTNDKCATPT
jgi:hypothetical protein